MDSDVQAGGRTVWRTVFAEPSLSIRFATRGGLIAIAAALVAGAAISEIVARSAVDATAASTALFMESFLAPAVNELLSQAEGGEAVAELGRRLDSTRFADRFPYLEIWLPDGRIAFSTTEEIIGVHFVPPAGLVRALEGEIVARYSDLEAEEHQVRHFDVAFLEVYVPLRDRAGGDIVAVAEIHEITGPLQAQLRHLRTLTWISVLSSTLLVMLALYGVVRHGSHQIEDHRRSLHAQLAQTRRISEQNVRLRERVRHAARLVSYMNESNLRDIGSELHDGPAQLIGLAALRVEHARRAVATEQREIHLGEIETLLSDANLKVRNLSKGLVLPNIDDLPLHEVAKRAARVHEKKTGTEVELRCGDVSPPASKAINTCVYRFIQEGLNNAFRHAGGRGQRVQCDCSGGILSVAVGNAGVEAAVPLPPEKEGLGLTWIRARVESLGGTMHVCGDGTGTTMAMTLPLEEVE